MRGSSDAGRAGERSREAEMAVLFDQHYDRLCNLAYLIMGDRHLAEEIVMESLLKTFSGWNRIRDRARADAYVKRAVVNLCRSKIRRKAIEYRASAVARAAADRRPPEWEPEAHENARLLWESVKELPVRQRACIVLRYVEDLPEGEIAEILQCSVGTVRSQMSRARKKIGDSLVKKGYR